MVRTDITRADRVFMLAKPTAVVARDNRQTSDTPVMRMALTPRGMRDAVRYRKR
jgi:hypothetical protein